MGPVDALLQGTNKVRKLDVGASLERVETGVEESVLEGGLSKGLLSSVPERGESPKDTAESSSMEGEPTTTNKNDAKEMHGSVSIPKQHIKNVCILANIFNMLLWNAH